jgi:hypothetical protein
MFTNSVAASLWLVDVVARFHLKKYSPQGRG